MNLNVDVFQSMHNELLILDVIQVRTDFVDRVTPAALWPATCPTSPAPLCAASYRGGSGAPAQSSQGCTPGSRTISIGLQPTSKLWVNEMCA